jgi:hypothetical protein
VTVSVMLRFEPVSKISSALVLVLATAMEKPNVIIPPSQVALTGQFTIHN